MSSQWFLNHRGHLQGPFSDEQIIERIVEQSLGPDDLIYLEGEAHWRPLSEINQFKKSLKEAAALKGDMPTQEDSKWVVLIRKSKKKREQKGPFDTNEVRKLLKSGQLHLSDYIWRPGMKEWYRVQSFPELFQDPKPSKGSNVAPTKKSTKENSAKGHSAKENSEDLLSNVLELQTQVQAPELPPGEAHGPDLLKVKIDPRDADELVRTKVNFKIPPRAKAKARATNNRGISLPVLGVIVLIMLIFLGAYWFSKKGTESSNRVASKSERTEKSDQKPAEKPTEKPAEKPVKTAEVQAPAQKPTPTPEPRRAPTYIKIKVSGQDIEIVTDASAHFLSTLEFTSRIGELIGSPSYYKVLQRKGRTLQLDQLGWPKGLYLLNARIGEQETEMEVFIGSKSSSFESDLRAFRKNISYNILNERIEMIRAAKEITDQFEVFGKILSKAGDSGAWNRDFSPWRSRFHKTNSGVLKSIGPRSRNRYVLAPLWMELKETRNEINKFTQLMSRKSERTSQNALAEHRKLLDQAKKLYQDSQSLSVWR